MTTLVATNFETLLSNVEAFQTWTGTANATAAAARIYIAGIDEGDYTRPCAIIATATGRAAEAFAGGGRDYHSNEGAVRAIFEADIAEGDVGDPEAEFREFGNSVGDILAGIEVLSGQGAYLHITGWRLEGKPQRAKDDEGDIYQVSALFDWGTW
jgi:hypothetical protein